MKVYLGPYPHWWSTYSFQRWVIGKLHKKDYYDLDDKDYTKLDHAIETFCDKWQKVLNATVNKISNKRKVKVHIDDYDCWGADHTLALIILPTLKKLKEQKHGSGFVEHEDVPEHLRPNPERIKMGEDGKIESWDVDNTIHQRWDYVLDEMIHAFETVVDTDWDDQFYSGEHDIRFEKREDGLSEMVIGPNDTRKFDKEAYDIANARRMNGLRLFAKYYFNLWD